MTNYTLNEKTQSFKYVCCGTIPSACFVPELGKPIIEDCKVFAEGCLLPGGPTTVNEDTLIQDNEVRSLSGNQYAQCVTLDKSGTIEATVGDKITLHATVYPRNTADNSLCWSASCAAKACVSQEGIVCAKCAGSSKITATTKDGSCKCASVTICVSAAPQPEPED